MHSLLQSRRRPVRRRIEHFLARFAIWTPVNYNKNYSLLFFLLVRLPLSFFGGYLPARTSGEHTTFFGEHELIADLFRANPPRTRFAVDIGAGDGADMNNVLPLYRDGWTGASIEADPAKFAALAVTYGRLAQVSLIRVDVSPDNVNALLDGAGCPRDFALLDLDIDSYDYYVLESVLARFRPELILAEINPAVPPPVKFTVMYQPDFRWNNDWFQSMSISQLEVLADAHGYDIIDLCGVSAFLVPQERTGHVRRAVGELFEANLATMALPPELAAWARLQPDEAVASISAYFTDHAGEFVCEV